MVMMQENQALGLLPGQQSIEFFMSEIETLKSQVGQLQAQQNVGNPVYGSSSIQTTLASEVYTVGPFRMDCDVGFPNTFDLWVPDNVRKLVRAQIRVKFRPIRTNSGVSSNSGTLTSNSGGGATSGSSSVATTLGGSAHSHDISGQSAMDAGASSQTSNQSGQTPVNVPTAGHTHVWANFFSATPGTATPIQYSGFAAGGVGSGTFQLFIVSDSTSRYTSPSPDATVSVTPGNHTHVVPIPSHSHLVTGTTSVTESAHVHPMDHFHNTPNHLHTIPGHTHTISITIAEGGTPAGVRLTIDAVDRSASLGGPWNADFGPVEITTYLVDAVGKPIVGAHPIILSTTQPGAIEASLDFYVIAKPVA